MNWDRVRAEITGVEERPLPDGYHAWEGERKFPPLSNGGKGGMRFKLFREIRRPALRAPRKALNPPSTFATLKSSEDYGKGRTLETWVVDIPDIETLKRLIEDERVVKFVMYDDGDFGIDVGG